MADRNEWGLTALGFRRPSYFEILDAIEYQAREKFSQNGRTPDLTVRSPLGLFLRICAWMVNLLFQLLEDVYDSRFVDTAAGASLYQLGRMIGMRLLPSRRASGYLDVYGTPGTRVPAGYLAATVAGIQFAVTSAGRIGDSGVVTLPIQCLEMGVIGNVAENTITQIVNPMEGIASVTNPSASNGGQAVETDEQFRDRYYKSVDFAGGVNADAIQAAILQQVEGVLAAKVYENDKDLEDARGLPPHSLEAVVYGGLDFEVAKAIYKKGAGIQTYGNTMVGVLSQQNGQTYEIHFSRPAAIPIWIKVTGVQIDRDAFPADGAKRLQDALTGYIGSDITGGLNIGESVVYNRLPEQLYSVPGVLDFSLEICTNSGSYARKNIPIGEREKAVTDNAKILITLDAAREGNK